MEKRAFSKNYLIKQYKFNLNNNIYTSHLSSNSNNLFYNLRKIINKKKKLKNINKYNLNLSYTPYTKNKNIIVTNNNINFYFYKKINNTTIKRKKKIYKNAYSRYFSADINNQKNNIDSHNKSYIYNRNYNVGINKIKKNNYINKSNKSCNYNTGRFDKNIIGNRNRNINDLTTYNKKTSKNKRCMNDISENNESISSFTSFEEEKDNDNKDRRYSLNCNKITDNNYLNNNKYIQISNKVLKEEAKINSPINNKKNRNIIMSPYTNKKTIKVQLLNNKKEKMKNIEKEILMKDKSNRNKKNDIKKGKKNKYELKDLTPIDLNNILNLSSNIIFQKVKKYFKKFGYLCKIKDNIIKADKGSSNIEIIIYKLKNLEENKGVYLSIKIRNKDLKYEKSLVREMFDYLKK